jgi:hypothetical protein
MSVIKAFNIKSFKSIFIRMFFKLYKGIKVVCDGADNLKALAGDILGYEILKHFLFTIYEL